MSTQTLKTRAAAYLTACNSGREIITDPEGHEEGFYTRHTPDVGTPYLARIAYLVEPDDVDPTTMGGYPFIVDVTGDRDEVLTHLD